MPDDSMRPRTVDDLGALYFMMRTDTGEEITLEEDDEPLILSWENDRGETVVLDGWVYPVMPGGKEWAPIAVSLGRETVFTISPGGSVHVDLRGVAFSYDSRRTGNEFYDEVISGNAIGLGDVPRDDHNRPVLAVGDIDDLNVRQRAFLMWLMGENLQYQRQSRLYAVAIMVLLVTLVVMILL